MSNISVQWAKHIKDEDQKKKFLQAVLASNLALSRLQEMVKERVQEINNSELKITDFEDSSWSHKQAFRNGQKAFAKELLDLLAFNK